MHCSVGLAILVKVGPISDCFDARHPGGLDRRHAGLADAAQQRFAQVGILNGCGGMIVQAAANRLRMRPAPDHVGCAQAHELAARVRHLEQRAEMDRLKLVRGLRLKLSLNLTLGLSLHLG